MALNTLQNFYKATVTDVWETGTGNRYISVLPTPTSGRLVINPSNTSKREIVEYSAVGTDGNGNYVTLSARGVGGTSDQTHDINEPVRMNLTAEDYADVQTELTGLQDEIDTLVLQNAPNASTSVKGIGKLSVAPVSATDPIFVGDNDERVPDANPDTLYAPLSSTVADVQSFSSDGTWTKPSIGSVVLVELLGAGAGGASGASWSTSDARGGTGGGSGGYSKNIFNIDTLPSTVAVTVGLGGTGGAGSTETLGNVGTDGGDTSFGTLLIAKGGKAGTAPSGTSRGVGGAGGAGLTANGVSGGGTGQQDGSDSNTNVGTGGGEGASGWQNHTSGDGGSKILIDSSLAVGVGGIGAITATNGSSPTSDEVSGGTGGGGGAGNEFTSHNSTGGNGGRGAGGGGGGANGDDNMSGAGGNGGNGFARITVF